MGPCRLSVFVPLATASTVVMCGPSAVSLLLAPSVTAIIVSLLDVFILIFVSSVAVCTQVRPSSPKTQSKHALCDTDAEQQ